MWMSEQRQRSSLIPHLFQRSRLVCFLVFVTKRASKLLYSRIANQGCCVTLRQRCWRRWFSCTYLQCPHLVFTARILFRISHWISMHVRWQKLTSHPFTHNSQYLSYWYPAYSNTQVATMILDKFARFFNCRCQQLRSNMFGTTSYCALMVPSPSTVLLCMRELVRVCVKLFIFATEQNKYFIFFHTEGSGSVLITSLSVCSLGVDLLM